jgi:hypothetical protein
MDTTYVVQALRERGYRVTPQRMEVVNLVMEKLAKREHPTFNDILNEVKQKMPSISASTQRPHLLRQRDSSHKRDLRKHKQSHGYRGRANY